MERRVPDPNHNPRVEAVAKWLFHRIVARERGWGQQAKWSELRADQREDWRLEALQILLAAERHPRAQEPEDQSA